MFYFSHSQRTEEIAFVNDILPGPGVYSTKTIGMVITVVYKMFISPKIADLVGSADKQKITVKYCTSVGQFYSKQANALVSIKVINPCI
jgi:hypothetical protein